MQFRQCATRYPENAYKKHCRGEGGVRTGKGKRLSQGQFQGMCQPSPDPIYSSDVNLRPPSESQLKARHRPAPLGTGGMLTPRERGSNHPKESFRERHKEQTMRSRAHGSMPKEWQEMWTIHWPPSFLSKPSSTFPNPRL